MINNIQSAKDKLLIESADGRKFELLATDFPKPTNEGDRVEVEQLIEKKIEKIFPEEHIKVHIFRLDPLLYKIMWSAGEIPEDWWVK